MNTEMPSWLTKLIEDNPPGPLARQYSKAVEAVLPGQLRYVPVVGQGYNELVLVLDIYEVDAVQYAACILIAGPGLELDMQDDTDIVLAESESELPYAVLAQAHITAVVKVADLGQHVGQVREDLCDSIKQLRDGEVPASLLGRLGMPLQGQKDVRWFDKQEQAKIAWSLSSAALG